MTVKHFIRWIWIRIRQSTGEAAVHALGERSDTLHREAMQEPDAKRSADLRAEADYYADEQKEMKDALYHGQKEKPEKPK